MISDSQPIPSYDRTWQVRLLVLTLLTGIFVGGTGSLASTFVLQRNAGLGEAGVGLLLSQILIDVFLVTLLVRRAENVFLWILGRAVAYGLLWWAAFIYVFNDLPNTLVPTYLASGISFPLLLLAVKAPGWWRRFAALLTLISYVLLVMFFVGVIVLFALYGD